MEPNGENTLNYKGALNELCQADKIKDLQYSTSSRANGKNIYFVSTVTCNCLSKAFSSTSENCSTKKEAERQCSKSLLALVQAELIVHGWNWIEVDLWFDGICTDKELDKLLTSWFDKNVYQEPFTPLEKGSFTIKLAYLTKLAISKPQDATLIAGYDMVLAELWNKLMHAINGNTAMKATLTNLVKKEKVAAKKLTNIEKKEKNLDRQVKKKEKQLSLQSGKKVSVSHVKALAKSKKMIATQGLKNEFQKEMLSMACPGAAPPCRYNGAFAGQATGVAGPWALKDAEYLKTTDPTPQLDPAYNFAFSFRDPVRNTVVWQPNRAGKTIKYDFYMVSATNSVPSTTLSSLLPTDGMELPVSFLKPSTDCELPVHGDTLGVGVTKDSKGGSIFLSPGDTITVIPDGSATSFRVTMYVFGDGVWSPVENNTANPGVPQALSAQNYGYHKIHVQAINETPGSPIPIDDFTCAAYYEVLKGTFAHNTLPYLSAKVASVDKIRMIGQSLMYSNRAPPLQAGGTVTMAQIPGSNDFVNFLTNVDLSKAETSKTMSANNGIYGFLMPTKPTDFDFLDYCEVSNGVLTKLYFSLDEETDYLAFQAVISLDEGKDGYFTFASNVEFLTKDVWFAVARPRDDAGYYERALASLRRIPQFHENPFHLSDLINGVKKVANQVIDAVTTYGPSIISAAKLVAPLFI